jgi:hypothetical protein
MWFAVGIVLGVLSGLTVKGEEGKVFGRPVE